MGADNTYGEENFNPKDENQKTNPNDLVTSLDIDRFPSVIVPKGITKREYFAAMALQGLCHMETVSSMEKINTAVRLADLLIDKLNEQKK